jgi:AcrR family transcriptional regulator
MNWRRFDKVRVRSDAKRSEILQAARAVFEEEGFEGATMSAVAARFGGSKATLYGYFASKDLLFAAVVEDEVITETEDMVGIIADAPDLRTGLVRCGKEYLRRTLGPRARAMSRLLGAQPETSGMGRHFYEASIRPAWLRLAERFEAFMAEGVLAKGDPWTTAMHYKGLLDGDLLERRVMNALPVVDEALLDRVAAAGVDAFLRAYAASAE